MKTNCCSMKGKIWERGIWFKRGGCVFSHDGSCGVTLTAASVCLQLWINRLEARDLVLVEGDTHSCGAANIGAGSRWGERAENLRPASMCLWCRTGATRNCGGWFVYPPRETQTTPSWYGAPVCLRPDCEDVAHFTPKNVPWSRGWMIWQVNITKSVSLSSEMTFKQQPEHRLTDLAIFRV